MLLKLKEKTWNKQKIVLKKQVDDKETSKLIDT